MTDHNHRRFPFFFVHELLPELFFSDPERFFAHLNLESLRSIWLEGNRELNEKTPPDGLAIESVDGLGGEARLVKLPKARYAGEAVAVLMTSQPAMFCLERAQDDGFALTALEAQGKHRYLRRTGSADPAQLIQLLKSR